ncbi:MAG: PEGA domain-containing protein [Candidatus Aureabacteria bacterium]|nr:PEGA domain-containing protein [Candidatus Auribacterota bacterium]
MSEQDEPFQGKLNAEKPFCHSCGKEYETGTQFCPIDGTPLIIRSEDVYSGKTLNDRYLILHKIGEGGMGAVYKARQITTGKIVAVKLISRSLMDNPETVRRFQREVKLQSRLEHPNIVTVIDFDQTQDGLYYFVMAFVEGKSLRRMILEKGRFSLASFFLLAEKICDGVAYAHQSGIIHRDLKGDNIIVIPMERQAVLKILDFGLAKAVQEEDSSITELSKSGMLLGTPAYMSPEQARGDLKRIGPQSDIYSMGVIFFQMLSGKLPFQSNTPWGLLHKHIYEKPASLRKINPHVPVRLEKIILKCLHKIPVERFPDVLTLKHSLMSLSPGKYPEELVQEAVPLSLSQDVDETVYPDQSTGVSKNKLIAVLILLLFTAAALIYYRYGFSFFPVKRGGRTMTMTVPSAPVSPAAKASGNILIETEPPGSLVSLGQFGSQLSPAEFKNVSVGKHELRIQKEFHETISVHAEVIQNQTSKLKYVLKREQSELVFSSDPSEAEIILDQKKIGKTPFKGMIETGEHRITLQKEGFQDREWTFILRKGEKKHFQTVVLERETGSLRILLQNDPSVPQDAPLPYEGEITVGKGPRKQVKFPWMETLSCETHEIGLNIPGYLPVEGQQAEIVKDKQLELVFIVKPMDCEVRIVCVPEKAEVFENGKNLGTAGQSFSFSPFVLHELEIICPGYETKVLPVLFNHPGQKSEDIKMELVPLPSYLFVTLDPSSALLTVNGEKTLSGKIQVKPDQVYQIKAENPGYQTFEKEMTVPPGQTQKLEITLEPSNPITKILQKGKSSGKTIIRP